MLRRIEVMKMGLHALREVERREAIELVERAIKGYEVRLERRRDDEARKIRERMPTRQQLAEVLGVASKIWREFNNEEKAEIVGKLAEELAADRRGNRERPEVDRSVIGFNGQVRGVVLEKGRENTISFKVGRVLKVWTKVNKAEKPEALAGRTIRIAPNNELHARFLGKLQPRQEVTIEIRGGERNRFVVTELSKEQRENASTD